MDIESLHNGITLSPYPSQPVPEAARPETKAEPPEQIALSEVWVGLVSGTMHLVDGWHTAVEAGLILECCETPRAVSPKHVEILRRVLVGESQKCVADWANIQNSTVAGRCTAALRAMGRQYQSSRVPLLLMLAAHAASGKPLGPAQVARSQSAGRERLTLSVRRTELARENQLTNAERIVFAMFVGGCSYSEIAQECQKSIRTVANQLQSARRKCAEGGRAAALGRLLV